MKKTINNAVINYEDVVHHTTTTRFSFWDRLKILFGGKVIVESELYTAEQCNILGVLVKTNVQQPTITLVTLKAKVHGYSYMAEPEKPNTNEKPI